MKHSQDRRRLRRSLLGGVVATAALGSVIPAASAVVTPTPTTTTVYLNSNVSGTDTTQALCVAAHGCGPTVATSRVLLSAHRYTILVDGTISSWGNWHFTRCGNPEAAPQFASGQSNPTGDDAQFRFARTAQTRHCAGIPKKTKLFQINLGAGWFHPVAVGRPTRPSEDTDTSQHPYTFSVLGLGHAPQFRYVDYHPSDNSGKFRIQITG